MKKGFTHNDFIIIPFIIYLIMIAYTMMENSKIKKEELNLDSNISFDKDSNNSFN